MNEQPKKSGTGKWIAIGCLIPVLLILGASVAAFFFGYKFITKNFVVDPSRAEKTARSIMEYRFPGGSQGLFAMNIMGMEMAAVQSRRTPPEAALILASFPPFMASQADENFERSVRDNFSNRRNLKVKSTRRIKKRLCGRRVTVVVQNGTMDDGGNRSRPMTSYQSMVEHKSDLIFILAMGYGQNGESHAARIFETLRCR